jgi:hypothetical protein
MKTLVNKEEKSIYLGPKRRLSWAVRSVIYVVVEVAVIEVVEVVMLMLRWES